MRHRLPVVGSPWSVVFAVVLLFQSCPLQGTEAFDDLRLDNPVLTSQEQIDRKLADCKALLHSLTQAGSLSPAQSRLEALAGLFVIFAGPEERPNGVAAGRLELVDLAKTGDSAVRVLRDQIKVPCPAGLVFIRYYPSRHVMPLEILPAFQRENTRGATILSRYIAILEKAASDSAQQRFLQQSQERILSHELVHAYINSVLGRDRDLLPLWFHEACATFLSGSPGGLRASELVETPVGFRQLHFQDGAPRDYQQYKLMFEYLRAKSGRRKLYAQIRQAIDTRSVQSLLACARVTDGEGLLLKAQTWKRTQNLLKYGVAAALVVGLLWAVWRMLPQRPRHQEPLV